MNCSSTTKNGCEATSGTFHAEKECKALGYKSCGGGWYKPGSVMCKSL